MGTKNEDCSIVCAGFAGVCGHCPGYFQGGPNTDRWWRVAVGGGLLQNTVATEVVLPLLYFVIFICVRCKPLIILLGSSPTFAVVCTTCPAGFWP